MAQSDETPTPGAWWAQSSPADSSTACAAATAWDQAMSAEARAEHDLSTDGLASALRGSELAREQQVVADRQARGQVLASEGFRIWNVESASDDEAVVFATSTHLVGYEDPDTSKVSGPLWVEEAQVAYRVARDETGWHVTDRHVLEQHRHPADLAAMSAALDPYQRLLTDALGAFATGDSDDLDMVLDGQALELYRQRVAAAAESGALQQVTLDGTFFVIDASSDTAIAAFSGTRSTADIDQTDGTVRQPSQQPYTVLHRLERQNGDWKIVYEAQDVTRRDPDGTVHLAGCSGGA
jgi:hypothetical protein